MAWHAGPRLLDLNLDGVLALGGAGLGHPCGGAGSSCQWFLSSKGNVRQRPGDARRAGPALLNLNPADV